MPLLRLLSLPIMPYSALRPKYTRHHRKNGATICSICGIMTEWVKIWTRNDHPRIYLCETCKSRREGMGI
jgi:hypothetical protein